MYDYLIVGAGLFGSVFAYEMSRAGYSCIVIEKRNHIGGNCYSEHHDKSNIEVHKYGAHIFKTDSKSIWDYVNQFSEFNNFINEPVALCNGSVYNLPFNMNTFSKVFNISEPGAAKKIIENESSKIKNPNKNLKNHAISIVGSTLYKMFIEGYTEKQWGISCTKLPSSIMQDIPCRYTYNNNYYDYRYQGVPKNGYTEIFKKLLSNVDVRLNTDYFENAVFFNNIAKNILYTGPIDKFFDYKFGKLEYRSLNFYEDYYMYSDNVQGVAVLNYSDSDCPYTRSIEHKHFNPAMKTNGTVITYEEPVEFNGFNEPYYPIPINDNIVRFQKYNELADKLKNKGFYFGGRLATYDYDDMAHCIGNSLKLAKEILEIRNER